jgi:hypothetical protein
MGGDRELGKMSGRRGHGEMQGVSKSIWPGGEKALHAGVRWDREETMMMEKKMKNDRDAVYVQLIAIMIYNGSSLYRYKRCRSD